MTRAIGESFLQFYNLSVDFYSFEVTDGMKGCASDLLLFLVSAFLHSFVLVVVVSFSSFFCASVSADTFLSFPWLLLGGAFFFFGIFLVLTLIVVFCANSTFTLQST